MDQEKEHKTVSEEDMYAAARDAFGPLLLPRVGLKLREGTTTKSFDVYDPVRRKWVALTPEEWVRQHFMTYLTGCLGFPFFRISNEVSLKFNTMSRRVDTVVYADDLAPLLIVEYKAPHIALDNAVLGQVARYNLVLGAKAMMITNGKDVFTVRNGNIFRGVVTFAELTTPKAD